MLGRVSRPEPELTADWSPRAPRCWCGCCVSPGGRCSSNPSWPADNTRYYYYYGPVQKVLVKQNLQISSTLRHTRLCLKSEQNQNLTSCLRSCSDSPAYRYRCCSNSYRVVFVTTATFPGLNPAAGSEEVWTSRRDGYPVRLPNRSRFATKRRAMTKRNREADYGIETGRGSLCCSRVNPGTSCRDTQPAVCPPRPPGSDPAERFCTKTPAVNFLFTYFNYLLCSSS